eukprot:g3419.t2
MAKKRRALLAAVFGLWKEQGAEALKEEFDQLWLKAALLCAALVLIPNIDNKMAKGSPRAGAMDRQESPPPGHFARIRELSPFAASELPTLHDMAAELSTKATEFSAKAQATATELSAKATEFSAKAQATATELSARAQATATELSAKAHELSDSIFNHMFRYESAAEARRRALMLVDVLVERHSAGRLKRRWVFAAAFVTFCYLHYILPVLACWGSRRWEQTLWSLTVQRSVDASEFEATVGGHNSHVSFAVLVVVSLGYLSMLHCSSRLMEAQFCGFEWPILRHIADPRTAHTTTEWAYVGQGRGAYASKSQIEFVGEGRGEYAKEVKTTYTGYQLRPWARLPIQSSIFEMLVVYNMTQMLFNAFVCSQLLREAYLQGFTRPWGNIFTYTKEGHRLGYFIWLHYHGCQLELLDTLFVVIRKKL